jgi:SOS-response transcriptional repressor LexA
MALKERIQEIISAGFSRAALAKAAKKTNAAVTHWVNGASAEIKADSAAGIQALTGFSAVWIATGKGPKRSMQHMEQFLEAIEIDPITGEAMFPKGGNVVAANSRKAVPLISWVKAGGWGEVEDEFQPGEAEDWIDAYETQPGESSFALRVTGDSMTSPYPGDLSFPEGTIIIVDPARAAHAGDYVVAKDVGTQTATFKRLAHDAGRWYLKPLNPTYPSIEIDDPAIRVIGRVIEFRRGGKL